MKHQPSKRRCSWPPPRCCALPGGRPRPKSTITVFDWSGYEDPAFHEAFTEKHGFSPNFAFFADEEEGFQKLRAGFKADLAHPCSQSVPRWREAGLLEPIDPAADRELGQAQPAAARPAGLRPRGQALRGCRSSGATPA